MSNTRETLVNPAFPRDFPPSNIRSVSFPARTALELLGPRTKRMASVMLDLPEPFGPVTAVYPSMSGTAILPPNDLKFSISTAFKCNCHTSPGHASLHPMPCLCGFRPGTLLFPDARTT